MPEESFKRKLTTMFSADVAGYSRLMAEDEAETVKTLKAYREIMTELIKQQRGRVVDSPGDNVLAEFTSVVDAVQCAVAVQKELQIRNAELPENRRMEFRIGINLGDVIEDEDRIYGDGVNIAARLEALAEPGGICISKTAFDHIETKLPLGYEYLGEQSVKNIPKPVGAYRVLMEPRVTVAEKIEKEKAVPVWRRKAIFAGGIAVIVAAIAVAIWNFYLRPPPIEPASVERMALPLPEEPSIAVLPFANLSGDPEQEYFSDGITEEIITGLAKIPQLFVIARNSTFTYKGKPVKVQKVAEDLGVRYVLEGGVRKAGDKVRITAQLIDAISGRHLWAERYDRKIDDIFSVQDNVTRNIIKALQVRLTIDEQDKAVQAETDSIEAYDTFLKGWGHYLRYTAKDFSEALSYFEKAVKMDPDYGRAYAALALIHKKAVDLGYLYEMGLRKYSAELLPRQYLKLAMRNPTALALNVAADMDLHRRQYGEAFLKAKHAIALDPNDPESQAVMAKVLIMDGKPGEALVFVKKAMRLDPHNQARYFYLLGLIRFCMGQLEEATILIQKAHSLIPEAYLWSGPLAAAYEHLGKRLQARAALKNFVKFYPFYPNLTAAMFYFPFKDPTVADRLAEGLLKAGLPGEPSGYYKVSEEDRLSGEEIRSLFFGRTRSGFHFRSGDLIWKEATENGKITKRGYESPGDTAGTSWIESDMLCERFYDIYTFGLEECGPVFRNPSGSEKLKNEYVWMTDGGTKGWSLAK